MLNHETVNRLRYMKLTGMADSLKEQDDDSAFQEMGFYDRLGLMVDREFNKRQHSRLQRLVSRARFQNTTACVEDIRYDDDRRLDRGFIMELASCTIPARPQRPGHRATEQSKPLVGLSNRPPAAGDRRYAAARSAGQAEDCPQGPRLSSARKQLSSLI